MSRTRRVLQILSLFNEQHPVLRATDIARILQISGATAYRCIAELEDGGFLESVNPGEYRPGVSIVRLDRHIRLHDPLLQAASTLMRELSSSTGATALLCRLHNWDVLCIHEEKGIRGPNHISYERGRAMSLFKGASSRAILANLDTSDIEKMRTNAATELQQAGLPEEETALVNLLTCWRQQRVLSACEEVDKGVIAWGVALKSRSQLLGSLSLLLRNDMGAPPPAQDIARRLSGTALRIEARLEHT